MKYVIVCSACLLQIDVGALSGGVCPNCHSSQYIVRMELPHFLEMRGRIGRERDDRIRVRKRRIDAGRA